MGRVPAALLLLLLATIAAHARGLGSDFVYDARAQIAEDDYVHEPRHLGEVLTLRVLARDVLDGNRPTQLASLLVDGLVWGRRPFGFHLTNLLLHLACVLMLYDRARAVGTLPAAVGVAFFALHPLVVEVVAEPSYREDLLVGFFVLLAAWLWTGWRGSPGRALGVVACALAAVGAKESGVAVIAVLALLETAASRRARFLLLAIVAAVVAAFLLARFALAPSPSQVFPVAPARLGGSVGATLFIDLHIFALYLLHIVWPVGLSADYTPGAIAGLSWLVGAGALALFVAGQVWLARRSILARFGAVWFWAALLPAFNLLPMYRPLADRYLYVPLMGCALMLAGGLALIRAPFARLAALALVPLALLSFARHGVFASEEALWTDTVAVSPDSSTAWNNLGWARLDRDAAEAAGEAFSRAVALTERRDADPIVGLGLAAFAQGRAEAARGAFAAAIALDRSYASPEALRRGFRLTRAQAARLQKALASLQM